MSQTNLCASTYDVRNDHGGFALCKRVHDHDGVHYGPAPDNSSHQWSESEAYVHSDAASRGDELSIWQLAVPQPETLCDVSLSNGLMRRGRFEVAIFDDSGPRAIILVLTTEMMGETVQTRRTISWEHIVDLSWEQTS